MSMSRKNFEAIADAISEASTCDNTEELLAVLMMELMRHFKEENALFNAAKFIEACGI